MDVRRQLSIVRAWLPLVVASVVLAGIGAFYISSLLPKEYQARTTLVVGQSLSGVNPDYTQLLASQSLSRTYAAVATTRPVVERVIDKLALTDSVDVVARRISADAATDGTLLTISGKDATAAGAAALANAVAEELIAASPTVQGQQTDVLKSVDEYLKVIRDEIDSTQTELDTLSADASRTAAQETRFETLQSRIVSLRATYASLLTSSTNNASNNLTVVEPAVAPLDPSAPRPLLNALLAAIIAFLVAAAIVFAAEFLDESIKDPEQVLETTGLPTLGSIVKMRSAKDHAEMYRLVTLLYPRSPAAEAFRTLRTNVEFASVDAPIKSLLVTSAVPFEGKTTVAANLAVTFAQGGRKVLLVDADLRRPAAERMFALPNQFGLTTMLRGSESRTEFAVQSTEQENLKVLSTGPLPPNPAEVLASQRMRTIVGTLGESFDLLVFDSPPLDVFADAAVLGSYLDGTIMVVDASKSRRKVVRQARESLAKANAKVLGAVLNGLPERAYSHYYENYGEVSLRDEAAASRS